ncbi:DUF5954 family protein [Streptomyces syringium]|uniref:DUF5954 family protein n=1 Tax=Streptomyces syringium TaxID=76729 RepID=UPI003413F83D
MEADALAAALDVNAVLVRGPLFGVAAQDAGEAPRWRVVVAVEAGCPQQARDSLNSLLWFRAKDEAQSTAERRALLAAVARLESECVDELTVLQTRYRVVRAEEYAGLGQDGIEQPRPTDPEPAVPNWDRGKQEARIDDGLVLDPEAPVTPLQAAEQLALRDLDYAGARFPEDVRRNSQEALTTHPDVMLLPPVFRIVEKDGPGWKIGSGAHATAHDTRKTLDFSLTWLEPRQRGLIPWGADDRAVDARAVAAEGTDPAAGELAEYAQAADRLRTERANRIEVGGTVYQICRARRLLRWGPDGPEGPRPSDTKQPPTRAASPLPR